MLRSFGNWLSPVALLRRLLWLSGRGCAQSRRVLLTPGPMPVATRQRRREPARFAGGDRPWVVGAVGSIRRGLPATTAGDVARAPPPSGASLRWAQARSLPGGELPVACARLVNLTHGSSLVSATEDAYGDGHTGLVRVGSAGAAPGAW